MVASVFTWKSDKCIYTEHTRGPERVVFCRSNSAFPRTIAKKSSEQNIKANQKQVKIGVLDPQNNVFVEVKPLVMETHVFRKQKIVFGMRRLGLKPCISQRFRMIFLVKNSAFVGPSWLPPGHENGVLVREW